MDFDKDKLERARDWTHEIMRMLSTLECEYESNHVEDLSVGDMVDNRLIILKTLAHTAWVYADGVTDILDEIMGDGDDMDDMDDDDNDD